MPPTSLSNFQSSGSHSHHLGRFLLKAALCMGLAAGGLCTMVADADAKPSVKAQKKTKNAGKISDQIIHASSKGSLNVLIGKATANNLVTYDFMQSMSKCLDSMSVSERENCLYAISMTAAPRFASLLSGKLTGILLNTNENSTKIMTIRALGKLEGGASKAVPTIAKALKDKSSPVRKEAALALGKMKVRKYGPDILEIMKNPDEYRETRQGAMMALAEMNYAPAGKELVGLLDDSGEFIRMSAIKALCAMNHPAGKKAASDMASAQEEYRRSDAVQLLLDVNQGWARDLLAKVLQDSKEYSLKLEAARALGMQKDKRGVEWLVLTAWDAQKENDFDKINKLEMAIEDAKIPQDQRKAILKAKGRK